MKLQFRKDSPKTSVKKPPASDVARGEPNRLQPDLKVIFEVYTLDHQNARVGAKYEVKPSEQVMGEGQSGREPISLGTRGKFMTEPAPWKKFRNESIGISQSRVQVMKKKREDKLTAAGPSIENVSPDNLSYHDDPFVTEIQFVSYDLFRDAGQFDQAIKSERSSRGMSPGAEQDPRYRRNRLIILWDDNERRVTRYMLDGEELEVPESRGG